MAIVVNSANATSSSTGSGTLTFSHTLVAGSNRVVIVGISLNASAGSLSITYDGFPMSFIRQEAISSIRIVLAFILEADLPGTGAHNVVSTYTGTVVGQGHAGGAVMFSGAVQQPPEANSGGVNPFPATGLSTGITTLTDNALVIDMFATLDDGTNKVTFQSPTSPQNEETDWNTADINGGISTKFLVTAGFTSMGWTWGAGSIPALQIVSAWAEDGGGAPPTRRDVRTQHRTFVGPSATGLFTVDRIGFIPKAAWIWTCGTTTANTATSDSVMVNGYCDGSLVQRSVGSGADDGAQLTWRRRSTTHIVSVLESQTKTVIAEASVDSFSDDEMVLDFTTLAAQAQGMIFHVVFFGGEDLEVELVSSAASAGSVSGLGFQPEFVLTQGNGDASTGTSNFSLLSVGCFNDALDEFHSVLWAGNDSSGQTTKEAIIRSSGFSGQLFSGSMTWETSVSSITATGFTWSGSDGDVIDFLCFNVGGILTVVDTFTKSTSAAPVTQAIPFPASFNPLIYALYTSDRTNESPVGGSSAGARQSVGVYARGQQSHTYRTDVNSSTNSDRRDSDREVIGTGTSDASYNSLGVAQPILRALSSIDMVLDPNDARAVIFGVWGWMLQGRDDDPAIALL